MVQEELACKSCFWCHPFLLVHLLYHINFFNRIHVLYNIYTQLFQRREVKLQCPFYFILFYKLYLFYQLALQAIYIQYKNIIYQTITSQ